MIHYVNSRYYRMYLEYCEEYREREEKYEPNHIFRRDNLTPKQVRFRIICDWELMLWMRVLFLPIVNTFYMMLVVSTSYVWVLGVFLIIWVILFSIAANNECELRVTIDKEHNKWIRNIVMGIAHRYMIEKTKEARSEG